MLLVAAAALLLLLILVVVVVVVVPYWGGGGGRKEQEEEGFGGGLHAEKIIPSIPTEILVNTYYRWSAGLQRIADRVSDDAAASQRFAVALATIKSASTAMATAKQSGEAATAAVAKAFSEVTAPKMSETDAVAWLTANDTQRGPDGTFADQYKAVQDPTSLPNWQAQPVSMQHFIVLSSWLQVKQKVFYLMQFGPPAALSAATAPAVQQQAVPVSAVPPQAVSVTPATQAALPVDGSRVLTPTAVMAPAAMLPTSVMAPPTAMLPTAVMAPAAMLPTAVMAPTAAAAIATTPATIPAKTAIIAPAATQRNRSINDMARTARRPFSRAAAAAGGGGKMHAQRFTAHTEETFTPWPPRAAAAAASF